MRALLRCAGGGVSIVSVMFRRACVPYLYCGEDSMGFADDADHH